MDALDNTVNKLNSRDAKVISRLGLGDTDQGLALCETYLSEYQILFAEQKVSSKSDKGFRGKQRLLLELEPELLACLAVNAALTSLGADNPNLTNTLRTLGTAAYMQCYSHALAAWDLEQSKKLETLAKRSHSSLKYRRAAVRAHARRADFRFDEWTDTDKLTSGRWLLQVLLKGPAFVLDGGYLLLTPEARNQLDGILSTLVLSNLMAVPEVDPLPPWEAMETHVKGLPYHLVRTYQKPVKRFVDRSLKTGGMKPVLDALNASQEVRWRINEPVYRLVRECFDRGVPVPGLPPKEDLPKPDKPLAWEDMTDTQRYLWRRKAAEVKMVNLSYEGERVVLRRDLATADSLLGQSFQTMMNIDYRGRVYGVPHFNYQRQDYVRAMFMFDEGQVLNADGLYWLKAHVASLGDFGKISKRPFDERVWWTDDNMERLIAAACMPMDTMWWTEADKPFCFIATCMALMDALEGRPVHIPCSYDGSCSGLQHLAAMSRGETEARLVNLVSLKEPQDIYQTVANRVREKAQVDLSSEETIVFKDKETKEVTRVVRVADLARLLLDYGVSRSLVKRNVMTYSYSSKRSGMQDQLMEDTMRPLALKVLSGDLDKHPFGDDGGYAAARYLSGLTYSSIVETVSKPAEVMRFLQTVARVMAHEQKPVTWTTPLGMPVMLRTPNVETVQINLFLHDKGVNNRLQPRSLIETVGIDKMRAANAVAPSFVHAYDACHLMMVVLRAKQQGIHNIALVHDSFGCLPNDASLFRQIIKETFVELYSNNDVLDDMLRENAASLTTNAYRLPEVPTKGSLDITSVLGAEYAFA